MSSAKKVLIDTDPGCDDMLALLLMLAAPDIDVRAVTTVAGNSTIQNVTNNARFILDLADATGVPLFSGAAMPLVRTQVLADVHGAAGLGDVPVREQVRLDNLAVEKILEIVRENPYEVSLLVLGPQTNIAQAIQRDPEAMKLAREIVIMGGAFEVPGNKNWVAEFNICVDPEAAAIVVNFPVPKTYIPLDVCNMIQVPIEDFEQINSEEIRQVLRVALTTYIANIQRDELPSRGALMYDVLVAYYILRPEACEKRDAAIVVETKGDYTFGMTLVDKRPFSKKRPPNASIVTNVDEKRFIGDFFSILNQKYC